ncbi:MAG: metallophosphoesterase [bacterium]
MRLVSRLAITLRSSRAWVLSALVALVGSAIAADRAQALSQVGPWIDAVSPTGATISFTANATSATVDYGHTTSYELGSQSGSPVSVQNPLNQFTNAFGNKFEIPLSGLAAASHYEYRVRIGASTFGSGSFDTAKVGPSSFTFVALGDTREGANIDHQRVRDCVISDSSSYGPYSFLLNTGDLQNSNNATTWQNFFEIESVNATSPVGKGAIYLNVIPFFPARGNHDFTQIWYNNFFAPPTFNSGNEDYYSFDYGSMHVVSLNANVAAGATDPQTQFLEADLLAQKNAGYPGPIVVFFHQAGVSSANHGNTSSVKNNWFPIFQEYGVDLVFQGHDHVYERFATINGVNYVTTGGAGADLYDITPSPWTVVGLKTHNYTLVDVNGQNLTVTAKNDSCSVIDSFTVNAASNNGVYHRTDPFPADAGSGSGCNVAGGSAAGSLDFVWALAPLALLVRRRSRS